MEKLTAVLTANSARKVASVASAIQDIATSEVKQLNEEIRALKEKVQYRDNSIDSLRRDLARTEAQATIWEQIAAKFLPQPRTVDAFCGVCNNHSKHTIIPGHQEISDGPF